MTKADIAEDGGGTFSEGDCIDLYAESESGSTHHLLTMRNGKWSPQIYHDDLGKGDVTLSAFYPAEKPAQEAGKDHTHSVRADQSTNEGFTASDLLYSTAILTPDRNSIEMKFSHAMHRIKVNVLPEDGGTLPDDLKVEILSIPSGSISMEDGSATVSADAEPVWITARKMQEGYAAILFPQPTAPYSGKDWIKVSAGGGKTSSFSLPSEIDGKPFTGFDAGKEVTVDLTVISDRGDTYTLTFDSNGGTGEIPPRHLRAGETTVMPDGAEYFTKENATFYAWNSSPEKGGIFDWVVGGTLTMPDHDMTVYAVWHIVDDNIGGASEEFKGTTQWLKGITPPKESDWEQAVGWDVTDGLDGKTVPIKPEYGWYDVSQRIYDMCWAAGTSDILHYWLDRNDEYVRRYGYDGPRKYDYDTSWSEIFDDFLDCWGDRNGSRVLPAFTWYLVGNETIQGGGYFKDVFEGKVEAESYLATSGRDAVSRKAFTEAFTRGFKEDMAISYVMPSIGILHQYVAWGAEYDDEGYIKGVYYVTTNDTHGDAGTVNGHKKGLIYMDVIYGEDGGTYVEASIPGYYIPITEVAVCGIGQDVWKEYYASHPEK